MYTRKVADRTIELGVTGKLYKDALVMYDRETGTLWTQVDGSALRGPLDGNRLRQVPATRTTWKVWKTLHPGTRVLRKPAHIRGSSYEDYFRDDGRRGLSGTQGRPGLSGKTLVVGLHRDGDSVAVPMPELRRRRVVEAAPGGERVVVFYSRGHETAAAFRAFAAGRELSFRLTGRDGEEVVEDRETGSRWDPLEGRALEGPLRGRRLEAYPSMQSYWYAWSAYRPGTRVVP